MDDKNQSLDSVLKNLYKPHPWHGVSPGDKVPEELQCFVEVVPSDTVKYEIDRTSGYLKVDRPQRFSSLCPALYGFVPQTLCGTRVGEHASLRIGRKLHGDGDSLDVCILTDRQIHHGNILVTCIPIGGLRMVDHEEADDKIIAVLKGDAAYGGFTDISGVPNGIIDRLRHYFLTYKQPPDSDIVTTEITDVYGRVEALNVIRKSLADYQERFGGLEQIMTKTLRGVQKTKSKSKR